MWLEKVFSRCQLSIESKWVEVDFALLRVGNSSTILPWPVQKEWRAQLGIGHRLSWSLWRRLLIDFRALVGVGGLVEVSGLVEDDNDDGLFETPPALLKTTPAFSRRRPCWRRRRPFQDTGLIKDDAGFVYDDANASHVVDSHNQSLPVARGLVYFFA